MIILSAFFVFALDRLTKILAVAMLVCGDSVKVIPGILDLTLIFNTGTAFGLFKGMNTFFIVFSVIIILSIFTYAIKSRLSDKILLIALGLIIGGAIGNLYDRILLGSVIDFIDFRIWPVFNLADSCITVGAVMLAWKALGKKCIR